MSAKTDEQVWIPVTVGCGCTLHFGPTRDNGINQPLRDVCRHRIVWTGTYLPKTGEALVGWLKTVKADEQSYAVEPESFDAMYLRRHGADGKNDHGSLL